MLSRLQLVTPRSVLIAAHSPAGPAHLGTIKVDQCSQTGLIIVQFISTQMATKLRIFIAGGGGFIGSHVAKRLKEEGHFVRVADWKKLEYFNEEEVCHEFHLLDLRDLDACLKMCEGIDEVYDFAADMGGMGFIQSNHSVILYNNIMIRYEHVITKYYNFHNFTLRFYFFFIFETVESITEKLYL